LWHLAKIINNMPSSCKTCHYFCSPKRFKEAFIFCECIAAAKVINVELLIGLGSQQCNLNIGK